MVTSKVGELSENGSNTGASTLAERKCTGGASERNWPKQRCSVPVPLQTDLQALAIRRGYPGLWSHAGQPEKQAREALGETWIGVGQGPWPSVKQSWSVKDG